MDSHGRPGKTGRMSVHAPSAPDPDHGHHSSPEVAANPTRCPHCGWPDAEPYAVVSRHVTSTGVVVYTRCACGRLGVRQYGGGAGRLVTSAPAVPLPSARAHDRQHEAVDAACGRHA